MKILLIFLLVFSAASCFGQGVDTVRVMREVDSLIQVSRGLTSKQELDKALEVSAAAEVIAMTKLGQESASYGSCCFNHGRILHFQGNYSEAEKWYLDSKGILGKGRNKDHPAYINTLFNLKELYFYLGKYEQAEPLYIEVKDILEIELGKKHRDYVGSIINLANLYSIMGNYEQSEPLYLEAKAILEIIQGKEHPDYASSLLNLANLYFNIGSYEKAELLYIEAKTIWGKTLGKEHPNYANCLNNLAGLYLKMANYDKAEPLYLEAKAIWGKTLGKEHPNYANSLNNLAVLYYETGNYEKVEPLFLEAKAIREKTLGREHPDYAQCLNNLATLYYTLGNYEKAEPLYHEARTIWEKTLGKEHPDYAKCLYNLANLYSKMSNYEKSEDFHLQAKAIREKTLGKGHADFADSQRNLAALYETQYRFAESEPLWEEYFQLIQSRLYQAVTFLSEREISGYATIYQSGGNWLSSFLHFRLSKGWPADRLAAVGYDHVLFDKGFLLFTSRYKDMLVNSFPEAKTLNNQLKAYHRRLAAEYSKPIAERRQVPELEEKANTIEKELARTVAGFGEAIRQVSWQEVQAEIRPGEAAVEFIHYRYYNPDVTDIIFYSALVLRPGDTAPVFVPLFEEREITPWLQNASGKNVEGINALYAFPKKRNSQKSPYDLIWKPLEGLLQGVNKVYCSPSGLLHRLNLGAVRVNAGQTFAEKHLLVQLGSTRQIVTGYGQVKNSAAKTAALFGGIRYDTLGQVAAEIPDTANLLISGSKSRGFYPGETSIPAWGTLEFSEPEVNNIRQLLTQTGYQVSKYSDYEASEEAFKSLGQHSPSPTILHLATHGFFYPDLMDTLNRSPFRGSISGSDEPVFRLSDDPMMRSGLILAGANRVWQRKASLPGREDGILTAYEISQMNLSNTELVVLSACETGLGDIQGNEGVYGLQRAFKIAGAKYLIMSLWAVNDLTTSELMIEFYRQWLEEKLDIPDAFRAAQLYMREKYPDAPYLWAGFVLVE